jgi:hypothetical protein
MKSIHPFFDRLHAGKAVPFSDPDYVEIHEIAARTKELSVALNNATDLATISAILNEITGQPLDKTTMVSTPMCAFTQPFILSIRKKEHQAKPQSAPSR